MSKTLLRCSIAFISVVLVLGAFLLTSFTSVAFADTVDNGYIIEQDYCPDIFPVVSASCTLRPRRVGVSTRSVHYDNLFGHLLNQSNPFFYFTYGGYVLHGVFYPFSFNSYNGSFDISLSEEDFAVSDDNLSIFTPSLYLSFDCVSSVKPTSAELSNLYLFTDSQHEQDEFLGWSFIDYEEVEDNYWAFYFERPLEAYSRTKNVHLSNSFAYKLRSPVFLYARKSDKLYDLDYSYQFAFFEPSSSGNFYVDDISFTSDVFSVDFSDDFYDYYESQLYCFPSWVFSNSYLPMCNIANVLLGSIDEYQLGYQVGFDKGNQKGYDAGYGVGFEDGSDVGFDNGREVGYEDGYYYGYEDGYVDGDIDGRADARLNVDTGSASYLAGLNQGADNAGKYTFLNLFGAILDAPIRAIVGYETVENGVTVVHKGLLSFEVFGVDLSGFYLGLLSACIIMTLVRLLLGAK